MDNKNRGSNETILRPIAARHQKYSLAYVLAIIRKYIDSLPKKTTTALTFYNISNYTISYHFQVCTGKTRKKRKTDTIPTLIIIYRIINSIGCDRLNIFSRGSRAGVAERGGAQSNDPCEIKTRVVRCSSYSI